MMIGRNKRQSCSSHAKSGRPLLAALTASAISLAVTSGPAAAQLASPPGKSAEPKSAADAVKITIASSSREINPGETFHLAVQFRIHPHWHIYWKNPGAAGVATHIDAHVPPGFKVGEVLFPRPQAFDEPEGITFGYEKQAVLFVPITAPDALAGDAIDIKVTVDYLVCRGICLIGQHEQTVTMQTSSGSASSSSSSSSTDAVAFSDSRLQALYERLPVKLDEGGGGTVSFDGEQVTITVPARGATSITFFPDERPGITFNEPKYSISADSATVTVAALVKPGNSLGKPLVLAGLVAIDDSPEDASYEFELPVEKK